MPALAPNCLTFEYLFFNATSTITTLVIENRKHDSGSYNNNNNNNERQKERQEDGEKERKKKINIANINDFMNICYDGIWPIKTNKNDQTKQHKKKEKENSMKDKPLETSEKKMKLETGK